MRNQFNIGDIVTWERWHALKPGSGRIIAIIPAGHEVSHAEAMELFQINPEENPRALQSICGRSAAVHRYVIRKTDSAFNVVMPEKFMRLVCTFHNGRRAQVNGFCDCPPPYDRAALQAPEPTRKYPRNLTDDEVAGRKTAFYDAVQKALIEAGGCFQARAELEGWSLKHLLGLAIPNHIVFGPVYAGK